MYKIDSGEGESFFAALAGSVGLRRMTECRQERPADKTGKPAERGRLNRRKADVQRNLLSQYRFKGENHYTV